MDQRTSAVSCALERLALPAASAIAEEHGDRTIEPAAIKVAVNKLRLIVILENLVMKTLYREGALESPE